MIDLKSLHGILNWHDSRDVPFGEKVGLFIAVPAWVAEQFPKEGKAGEDSSPPHITLLYIGSLPKNFEDKLKDVVRDVCDNFKSFNVRLGSVKKFVNDEQQKVFHSPIKSKKLKLLHETLKHAFQQNQLPFSTKYPEFKPHITIEYVNLGEKPKFRNVCPEGEWEVDHVWIWRCFSSGNVFLKIIKPTFK